MRVIQYFSILLFVVVSLFSSANVAAQCSMCRATVENNVKEGGSTTERKIGAGLNSGILYLMSIPYLLVSAVVFLWYRESRKNKKEDLKVKDILKRKFFGN
ncbi:hypothetical protein RCC89_17285 [Cytophagaceae bacterium ABcell3]|nr:hypothetical protein RCC89_17285 [Cytophagaceae bacterium ABcell3]